MSRPERVSGRLSVTVKELRPILFRGVVAFLPMLGILAVVGFYGPNKNWSDGFQLLVGPVCIVIGFRINYLAVMSQHQSNKRNEG